MRLVAYLLLFASAVYGQSANPHLAAARSAEASGDLKTAAEQYQRALKVHADAETYLRLGLVRHLQNQFSDAVTALQSSLKLQPDQWAARLFLGIDLYRSNDFAGAQKELLKAARLKPADYDTRFWLGVTDLAQKQYFEGLEMLESLSKERPGDLEVLRILAENYASFGTAMLNRVADRYPDTAEGMLVHAHALEFEGATEAAIEVYQEIANRWPGQEGVNEAIVRMRAKLSSQPQPSPEAGGGESRVPR